MAIKKCKGSTAETKGIGCGAELSYTERNGLKTYHAQKGLGIKCRCYQNWLLSSENGIKKVSEATKKVTAPRIELENAFEEKKERQKLSFLLTNVKNTCHEYVKLRDKGLPCISCGIPFMPNFQAGHFYKAELYSNLKYDEKNISGQCTQCNLRLEGNESGYRVGILQRYGEEHLKYLDDKAKAYKKNDFHWERTMLEEIRAYYQQKLKELKKQQS